MSGRGALLAIGMLAGCPGPRGASTTAPPTPGEEASPVRTRFFVEHATVAPGGETRVGVQLVVEDGWHVYWRYPGETGLATRLSVRGSGVQVAEPAYPIPEEFVQPGDIRGYGYERETFLSARVRVPEDMLESLPLEAEASWLVCRQICIPGNAAWKTVLRRGTDGGAPDPIFARWDAKLPVTDPNATIGGSLEDGFHIELLAEPGVRDISVFPVLGAALELVESRAQLEGNRVVVRLRVRQLSGVKLEFRVMDAVIVWTDPADKRQGRRVGIDITGS